jgi:hypothetical protein
MIINRVTSGRLLPKHVHTIQIEKRFYKGKAQNPPAMLQSHHSKDRKRLTAGVDNLLGNMVVALPVF